MTTLGTPKSKNEMKEFQHCVRNCEVGSSEVLKLQHQHAEVARLTYAKNVQRCQAIHGKVTEDEEFNPTALAHCLSHNTDKVDRRFFGYYNN